VQLIWVVLFKPWVPYSHLIGQEHLEQVSNLLPAESAAAKDITNFIVDGRSFINQNLFKNPVLVLLSRFLFLG